MARPTHLRADDNTLAAGLLGLVLDLVLGVGALRVIGEGAAGASAVELDTVTSAGDAVALASAAGGGGGNAGRGGGVGGAAGGQGRDIRVGIGVVLVIGGVDGELGGQGSEGSLVVLGVDDLAGLAGTLGLGGSDAGRGQSAALGDVLGGAAGLAGRGSGGSGRLGGNVDDVELAAGGGLGGVVLGGVVGDVVAVNDVVVPVALALLEGLALELEASGPSSDLLGVLGKGKLSGVVVPRAEKVDGLAVVGSAESEVKLDSGHCDSFDSNFLGY